MYQSAYLQNNHQSIISSLPNDTYHILIYPTESFAKGKYRKIINSSLDPFLIIIQDPSINDQQLASLFITQNNLLIKQSQIFFWQRQTAFPFLNMSISDLANLLQKDSIQGLRLEVNVADIDRSFYEDIASPLKKQKTESASLTFYLLNQKQYFCIDIQLPLYRVQFDYLRISLQKYLQKQFKAKIKTDKIKLYFQRKNQEIQLTLQNCISINRKDLITIKISDFVSPINKKQLLDNDFLVISTIAERFLYKKIRECKVQLILDNSQFFRKNGKKSSQYGLKIKDFIIMPDEKLCQFPQIENLFANKANQVKYINAQVINTSSLLYMDKFILRNSQIFAQDILSKEQQKKLIFEYSGKQKLRQSINSFLRLMSFAQINANQYQQPFKFAQNLINILKQMPLHKGVAYLGIRHKQQYKVGQMLQFNQFIVCSSKQEAIINSSENEGLFFFKECKSAKNIKQFNPSNDVIFMPKKTFKITQVTNKKTNHKQIDIIILEEQQSQWGCSKPQDLQILWVNKDINEGIQYSKQKWIQPRQDTYFIHLASTAQLIEWLKSNFNNKNKLALVTNMVRNEKGSDNHQAGADAIKAFREYVDDGKFFVFIGRSIELVIKQLKERGIPVDERQVSHKSSQLQKFIKGLIFE